MVDNFQRRKYNNNETRKFMVFRKINIKDIDASKIIKIPVCASDTTIYERSLPDKIVKTLELKNVDLVIDDSDCQVAPNDVFHFQNEIIVMFVKEDE